jgi:dihydrodipicolinate synthase/N-acetylneuraminate lyase
MSPELVADLARRFPNFLLFKDTSGHDRVAKARIDLGGVFLVRGMEGEYARWPKVAGGCYDGFLLATANSFGASLSRLGQALESGHVEEATEISRRLTGAIEALFEIVREVTGGNPFANAGKLADHYHAYGPQAAAVPAPRLHSGFGLTPEMVRAAGDALRRYELLPARGYLE